MAVKKVMVPSVGLVHLYKRRGSKSIRLSVTTKGNIRVTMPLWAPYRLGVEFVLKKQSWLAEKQQPTVVLRNDDNIGKHHRVSFIPSSNVRVTSRLTKSGQINVYLPPGVSSEELDAQTVARRACIRALKRETEDMLPQRLRYLAETHKLPFRSVGVKQLSSRWGSCTERKDIIINCFLIQLPWHLIDYVLLHELMHTKIMSHGPVFWDELIKHVPNLVQIRKEIRPYRPTLLP